MSGKPIDEAVVYVECRECRNCEHSGINDACATNAACYSCEWSGPSPTEDKCPGCGDSNCMGAACPKCGSLYRLIAEADVNLTAAQQPDHIVDATKMVAQQQDESERMADAWGEFESEMLTDGNGYSPADTYAACHAAFEAKWPDAKAAHAAATAEFRRLHPDTAAQQQGQAVAFDIERARTLADYVVGYARAVELKSLSSDACVALRDLHSMLHAQPMQQGGGEVVCDCGANPENRWPHHDECSIYTAPPSAPVEEHGPNWRYATVSAIGYIDAGEHDQARDMLQSALALSAEASAPSAPVGVEAFESRLRGRAGPFTAQPGERYVDADIALAVLREALAQQPAAVDGAMNDYSRGYKAGHAAATAYCVRLAQGGRNA